MKTLVASLAALTLLFAAAAPARADVGIERASPSAGRPGDRVVLTVGCGFCFPPCVGEPGHRHPPGELRGTCMLGHHGGPPDSFPIWMTPLGHSLKPYKCAPEVEGCEAGSSRPPHLPSFVYLGRAVPAPPGGEGAHEFPRYRLIFGVPEARPGRYKYVIFCDSCFAGPRGSMIENGTVAAGRLRVLPSESAAAVAGESGGAGLWIAGGAALAALALATGLLLRRGGAAGPRAGQAT